MLKGDVLQQKMMLLLLRLYEHGAIAHTNAVNAADLREAIGVTDQELEAIYLNLHHAGKIAGNPYGVLWLTNLGLQEASVLVQELREQAKRAAKPHMGFQVLDDSKS